MFMRLLFYNPVKMNCRLSCCLMSSPEENQKVEEQLRIAEIVNGRAAMLGFVAALGSYLTTGQILPGYF